jgi:HEAT repeat protein
LLAAAALCWAGTAAAQGPEADPVEALRKVLGQPEDPWAFLFAREDQQATLNQRLQALQSVSQLRRALLLKDWGDRPQETEARRRVAGRLAADLHASLRQGEPLRRLAAITLIGEIGTSIGGDGPGGFTRQFGPDLARLALAGDCDQRRAIARALGAINADPAVAAPAFAALLQADAVAVRRAAAEGLGTWVQTLDGITPGPSAKKDMPVAATYRELLRVVQAILPVADQALADPDAEVRRLALRAIQLGLAALGAPPRSNREDLGQKREIPTPVEVRACKDLLAGQEGVVLQALNDPRAEVRLQAVQTLGEMAQGQADFLQGEDPRNRELLVASLEGLAGRVHDPEVPVRLAALALLNFKPLANEVAPVVPLLVEAFKDCNVFVRWSAVEVLARGKPVRADLVVPALANLLACPDEDAGVRLAVIRTLGAYGRDAAPAVPALANDLGRGEEIEGLAVLAVLRGLGRLAEPAIPALARVLNYPKQSIRLRAAELLGTFGPAARAAEGALRKALDDSDAEVRRAAGEALLNILPPPGD